MGCLTQVSHLCPKKNLTLPEISYLPVDFPVDLDEKFAGSTFPAYFGSHLKHL
jgi:hypothetical protein